MHTSVGEDIDLNVTNMTWSIFSIRNNGLYSLLQVGEVTSIRVFLPLKSVLLPWRLIHFTGIVVGQEVPVDVGGTAVSSIQARFRP